MFIGNLEQYENFIKNLDKLASDYNIKLFDDEDNLVIDHQTSYSQNFFDSENSIIDSLKEYNISEIPIKVTGLGFDMISKAKNSNYGFLGEMESIVFKDESEGEPDDGTHLNPNTVVDQKTFEDASAKEEFEAAYKAQKFQQIELKPD